MLGMRDLGRDEGNKQVVLETLCYYMNLIYVLYQMLIGLRCNIIWLRCDIIVLRCDSSGDK